MKQNRTIISYIAGMPALDFNSGGAHTCKAIEWGQNAYTPDIYGEIAGLIGEGEELTFTKVKFRQMWGPLDLYYGDFRITPVLLLGDPSLTTLASFNTSSSQLNDIVAGAVTSGEYQIQVLPTVFPKIRNDGEIWIETSLNLTKIYNFHVREYFRKTSGERKLFRVIFLVYGKGGHAYVGTGQRPVLQQEYETKISANPNQRLLLK